MWCPRTQLSKHSSASIFALRHLDRTFELGEVFGLRIRRVTITYDILARKNKTAKLKSAKCNWRPIRQIKFPPNFPAIRLCMHTWELIYVASSPGSFPLSTHGRKESGNIGGFKPLEFRWPFVQRFLPFLASFWTTLVQILPILAIIWLKFLPFLAIIWFASYTRGCLSKYCRFWQ